MGQTTGINWTDHTGNFWWGCMKVSEGCQHCYAETFSKRVGKQIWGPASTTERWRTKGPWKDILKWDKAAKAEGIRRKMFCQSMSDFFEDHPQLVDWRKEACEILESLQWLDVQLLTKRPENVLDMVPAKWRNVNQWPAHIWIGTSVENQEAADKRIPELLNIPARILFLSCEPLLGAIDLSGRTVEGVWIDQEYADADPELGDIVDREGWPISWVIIGGESGHHARPMNTEWARSIKEQCQAANVKVWVKQLGGAIDKRHNLEDLPEDLRIREFPQ